MSSDGSIVLDRVWKRFRADRRMGQLRDESRRLVARLRGEQVGWRWALRDVSLEIAAGESVGLIGVNGSGKTTLLRIAGGVMSPNAGGVTVPGRVGGLIDVLAGIHPELSGRENIYLYGALLGMDRRAVVRRFDSVVAFADLADALDRPVKYYSTGMRMRLGFAVAAHLEPDVLLVDEVLAVGDASFQQRCLDRIHELIAGGTTVVFVSHDLEAVRATCTRSLWLDDGVVRADGPTRAVLAEYRATFACTLDRPSSREGVEVSPVRVHGTDSCETRTGAPLEVAFDISAGDRQVHVFVGVTEGESTAVVLARRDMNLEAGGRRSAAGSGPCPSPKGATASGSPCSMPGLGTPSCRGSGWLTWRSSALRSPPPPHRSSDGPP